MRTSVELTDEGFIFSGPKSDQRMRQEDQFEFIAERKKPVELVGEEGLGKERREKPWEMATTGVKGEKEGRGGEERGQGGLGMEVTGQGTGGLGRPGKEEGRRKVINPFEDEEEGPADDNTYVPEVVTPQKVIAEVVSPIKQLSPVVVKKSLVPGDVVLRQKEKVLVKETTLGSQIELFGQLSVTVGKKGSYVDSS